MRPAKGPETRSWSVADLLGIALQESGEADVNVFGGQRLTLMVGNATLRMEADGESVQWGAPVHFFDFEREDEEAIIFGHAGILDYFTATFDGQNGTLTLTPNSDMPAMEH